MSTFSGWWRSFKKTPNAKQITWVCGTEPVLIDEVVDLLTEMINPDPINYIYLDADVSTPRAVWSELLQLPFGTKGNRLVVVNNADKLLETPQFFSFVQTRGSRPRNFTIFVSNDESLRREEVERGRGEIVPNLTYLKTRGTLIECRAFTAATAKYAVEWVKEKGNIRGQVAEHLLNRATGDLRLVRDTLRKLSLFPGEITLPVVNEMMEEMPDDTFLSALFALDRKTALKSLKDVPKEEYSKTLGLVDARLDLAGLVHDLLIEKKSPGDIARAAGNKSFLVPEMLPVAKYYDKKRRLRIRSVLATIDGYTATHGVPDGAMEVLVASW